MSQETVSIPAWVFTDLHDECNKYLLTVFPDGTGDVDGCHGDKEGVAEAQHLLDRLGLVKNKAYQVMITIEPVPEFKGKVNEEAINTMRPIIEHYQEKKKKNGKGN